MYFIHNRKILHAEIDEFLLSFHKTITKKNIVIFLLNNQIEQNQFILWKMLSAIKRSHSSAKKKDKCVFYKEKMATIHDCSTVAQFMRV